MTPEQTARLEELRREWCSPKLVRELYGLDPQDDELMGRIRAWGPRVHRAGLVERVGGEMNRYALENFFQFARVLPRKWAAAELGMDEQSLRETLAALATKRLAPDDYAPVTSQPQLVEAPLIKDFYKLFVSLRDRVFGSHDDFCRRLHASIHSELGVEVHALRCVTARMLYSNPMETDYAHQFDVITLEPIGIRYQVWLDLGKPMNLRPDACSTKLYVEERSTLQPLLLAGTEPEIPAGLSKP